MRVKIISIPAKVSFLFTQENYERFVDELITLVDLSKDAAYRLTQTNNTQDVKVSECLMEAIKPFGSLLEKAEKFSGE
jgi:hypothetical protein